MLSFTATSEAVTIYTAISSPILYYAPISRALHCVHHKMSHKVAKKIKASSTSGAHIFTWCFGATPPAQTSMGVLTCKWAQKPPLIGVRTKLISCPDIGVVLQFHKYFEAVENIKDPQHIPTIICKRGGV